MHTFSETGTGVPAFLAKLWRLVDDPATNNLICWSKDGRSFIIQNQAQFAHDLLPLNYKHNNMASFIRQLNMYGFHKITSIENGGLKFDRDEMEFSHPCFKRNCPYLLEHIKRKIAPNKTVLDDKTAVKTEAVSKVLLDVKAMRGRQDSLDSRFSVMKQENEALWREIASLRQKHAKQQQIVNKLIQFLITIVQPSRNMSTVKRHMQLMINDNPENAKLRNGSESESDGGPVIHELGEDLLDEVAEAEDDYMYNVEDSSYANIIPPTPGRNDGSPLNLNTERPISTSSIMSPNYDYSNQSAEDLLNNVAAAAAAIDNDIEFPNSVPSVSVGSSTPTPAIIQSVNPDGTQIVYHVTEVPDTHPLENVTTNLKTNYNDGNVLTTPMVRKEMARTQLLKQKNKLRRQKSSDAKSKSGSTPPKSARIQAQQLFEEQQQKQQKLLEQERKLLEREHKQQQQQQLLEQERKLLAQQQKQQQQQLEQERKLLEQHQKQQQKHQQQQPQQQQKQQLFKQQQQESLMATGANNKPIQVKSEENPLFFLNDYADPVSPNHSEDSHQSNLNEVASAGMTDNKDTLLDTTTELYNANTFIDGEMPNNIFEDSSLISNDNTSFEKDLQQRRQLQQQTTNFNRPKTANGKFLPFVAGSFGSDVNNGASTSAAAKMNSSSVAAGTTNDDSNKVANYTASQTSNKTNNGNMAVVARDELNGHLENVQDELDTLKDLLRSDSYSLDANTLLGLFNDSDILGPYGMSLSAADTSTNDKKGSELMTYQPMYDLSDIMDINAEDDMDAANADVDELLASNNARQLLTQSSVLNTPYHE